MVFRFAVVGAVFALVAWALYLNWPANIEDPIEALNLSFTLCAGKLMKASLSIVPLSFIAYRLLKWARGRP